MRRQRTASTDSSRVSRRTKNPAKSEAKKKATITRMFRGSREGWLPVFHRLMARLSQMPATEVVPRKGCFSLVRTETPKQSLGAIWICEDGVRLGLFLERPSRSPRLEAAGESGLPVPTTHSILLTRASDIDHELVSWIKAAHHLARISRRRST
jgi:hypothetical protein